MDEGAVVLLVTLLCLAKSLVCELISDCVRSHKGEKTVCCSVAQELTFDIMPTLSTSLPCYFCFTF